MRSLTSFARKTFAIVSCMAVCATIFALAPPAMAQQQPAPVTVPGPFQGLGNVLRNPDAPNPNTTRPRPRANPPSQPAPPPTIIPPGTLDNGAR